MAPVPETNKYEKNEIDFEPDTVQLDSNTVEQKPDTVDSNMKSKPQTGKRQKVLSDLRASTLSITEQVQKQMVEVVKDNLNAFAESLTDL